MSISVSGTVDGAGLEVTAGVPTFGCYDDWKPFDCTKDLLPQVVGHVVTTTVNMVLPRFDGDMAITIGVQAKADPLAANFVYNKAVYRAGLKVTDCGNEAPYCLAAVLFMTPATISLFQKCLVMYRFMESWCKLGGIHSPLCQAISVRFFLLFLVFFLLVITEKNCRLFFF